MALSSLSPCSHRCPSQPKTNLCLLVLPYRMGAPDVPTVGQHAVHLWQPRAVIWVLPRLKCRVGL